MTENLNAEEDSFYNTCERALAVLTPGVTFRAWPKDHSMHVVGHVRYVEKDNLMILYRYWSKRKQRWVYVAEHAYALGLWLEKGVLTVDGVKE